MLRMKGDGQVHEDIHNYVFFSSICQSNNNNEISCSRWFLNCGLLTSDFSMKTKCFSQGKKETHNVLTPSQITVYIFYIEQLRKYSCTCI